MSESAPNRTAYKMNKYRKALRVAWAAMQSNYAAGVPRPELLPADVWPDLADFEIRAERRQRETI